MVEAGFWAIVAASSLILGAELQLHHEFRRRTIGLVMAFGVGMLVSSIAFELVAPAIDDVGILLTATGLAAGALVFFAGDSYIDRLGGTGRKSPRGPTNIETNAEPSHPSGVGIVLGTVLDGIPESAVLGMSLASGSVVSVSLLSAIWISNLPEALGSSGSLLESGMTRRRLRLMWLSIVAVSGLAAVFGYWVVNSNPRATGGLIEAFAAGSLLTMILDEMAPEAYARSGLPTGLVGVLGFVSGLALGAFS